MPFTSRCLSHYVYHVKKEKSSLLSPNQFLYLSSSYVHARLSNFQQNRCPKLNPNCFQFQNPSELINIASVIVKHYVYFGGRRTKSVHSSRSEIKADLVGWFWLVGSACSCKLSNGYIAQIRYTISLLRLLHILNKGNICNVLFLLHEVNCISITAGS